MLEQDDGRQEGEEDAAGRGVPRRAAGAGSGGGRDVAGGRAWLLRPRHRRALLRRVPPPLQARRGVLAAGRCPAATSGEGGASIDARAALEHLQMQRIVDFVHIRHLHLSWSCGSIRSQGIIISIIIICVGFACTIAADTTNITSFGFIGFGIITTHRGAQEWRDTEKEAKDNKTTEGTHTLMLLQNTEHPTIQHPNLRRAPKPLSPSLSSQQLTIVTGQAMQRG